MMSQTKYHSNAFIGDLFRASGSAYITPDRWQEFWEFGLVTTDSDCMSPRLTEDGLWLLKYVTQGWKAASRSSGGRPAGFVAGDWAHPSTIGYDADDDAPQGD